MHKYLIILFIELFFKLLYITIINTTDVIIPGPVTKFTVVDGAIRSIMLTTIGKVIIAKIVNTILYIFLFPFILTKFSINPINDIINNAEFICILL